MTHNDTTITQTQLKIDLLSDSGALSNNGIAAQSIENVAHLFVAQVNQRSNVDVLRPVHRTNESETKD